MTNHKIIQLITFILLFATLAHASLLISATMDKQTLSTDEVGLLTIKLFNDGDRNANKVLLTIKGDDQIRFFEDATEKTSIAKTIEVINSGQGIEARIKVKSISSKKPTANVYVYYGFDTNPVNAAVTVIQTQELPITVTTTLERKTINDSDTIVSTFKLVNNSKSALSKVSAELITPKGFDNNITPFFSDTLQTGGTVDQKFQLLVPLETVGEHNFILAYGYFDDTNTPHYFEKNYTINVQRANYNLLILVGAIVLIVGLYSFMKKDKKGAVQGTAEKK
jgi:hypothetical protein